MGSPLKVVRWFERVRDDITNVPDACEFYKGVILDGEKHVAPVGPLERLHREQPGLVHFYGGFHKDAIAVAKYLEDLYDTEHAKKYAWFHSPEAKQEYGDLKATDIKNYVNGDDFLWSIKQLHHMAMNAERQLDNLCDAMKTRGYYISNLMTIHQYKLEHVFIDATKENTDD